MLLHGNDYFIHYYIFNAFFSITSLTHVEYYSNRSPIVYFMLSTCTLLVIMTIRNANLSNFNLTAGWDCCKVNKPLHTGMVLT